MCWLRRTSHEFLPQRREVEFRTRLIHPLLIIFLIVVGVAVCADTLAEEAGTKDAVAAGQIPDDGGVR